eukprot:218007-Pyramimonas_sp.AAC.1
MFSPFPASLVHTTPPHATHPCHSQGPLGAPRATSSGPSPTVAVSVVCSGVSAASRAPAQLPGAGSL